MLALTTVVTSCGLLSTFLSFPEPLRSFVWDGIDMSQKEQFAIYRRNHLQFTGPFYSALGSLLGCWYRWRFLWLTSEEFFWLAGRLECLLDDSSLYPLFLPLPLTFEWYQTISTKNKAKKKGSQSLPPFITMTFALGVTRHRELDMGNSIQALHLLLLCWVHLLKVLAVLILQNQR